MKQKTAQLSQRALGSVLKEAKQRLNMRQKPKVAKTIGGEEVTDKTLAAMPNPSTSEFDCWLVVADCLPFVSTEGFVIATRS